MQKTNNIFLVEHKNIETFLQNNITDFAIKSIVFHEGDENIIAEVNNDLIFRFAKTTDIQKHMGIEIDLLKYLQDSIKICSIPYVMYYFPEAYCYGYRKIKGEPFSKELCKSLSLAQHNKLADDLAQFLYELHSTISIETAQNIGLVFADWPLLPKDLKNNLNIQDNDRLKKVFNSFINEYQHVLDTIPFIIIHNDIHEKNILIDPITKKLTGILDFTSASIGTIYHEFRYLHLIDQRFLKDVVQAYSEKSQSQLSLRNVYIFCLATEFSRLIERSQLLIDYEQIMHRIYTLEKLL